MRRVLLPLALGLPLVAVVLLVHRESPRTLVSAHGLLHAAIAERFRSGVGAGFPPENPYFAGEALPYYWAFQWAGAKLSLLLGTDPLHAFEFLVLAALLALVFACAELGRSLFGSVAAGLGIAWLALAGSLPQGPIVLLVRLGSWGMPAEDGYLWGIVHPIVRRMRVSDEFSMYGPLFPFFGNATARPLGLALLAVVVLAARSFLVRPGFARGAALAACAALLGCASSLLALSACSALAAGLLVVSRRSGAAAAGAIALGIAASFPTWNHLLGGVPLAFHDPADVARQLGRMGESGWLIALLAVLGLRASLDEPRPFLRACAGAAFVLAIGCAVLALPVGNEDNLFHGALVLLAVPAAGWLKTPARAALAVAAFLPTLCVQVGASFGRPPVDLAFEEGRIVRADETGPAARLESWIRESTEARAVFVIDPRPPIQAVAGNSAELPALTGRTLFTERAGHYLVAPNADGARRAEIAARLATAKELGQGDDALVEALGRDVYIVCREPFREIALQRLHGAPVFRAEPLSVFRWSPR
ncbi:MAG: DUF2298 domain-containing protein [Planctomycetota bacterium]